MAQKSQWLFSAVRVVKPGPGEIERKRVDLLAPGAPALFRLPVGVSIALFSPGDRRAIPNPLLPSFVDLPIDFRPAFRATFHVGGGFRVNLKLLFAVLACRCSHFISFVVSSPGPLFAFPVRRA
jgi:hypothetical protein